MWDNLFFWQIFTILNSTFSLTKVSWYTKINEPSLSCYFHLAGERKVRCISFASELALRKLLTGSTKIWTQVFVPISYYVDYERLPINYMMVTFFRRDDNWNEVRANDQGYNSHLPSHF